MHEAHGGALLSLWPEDGVCPAPALSGGHSSGPLANSFGILGFVAASLAGCRCPAPWPSLPRSGPSRAQAERVTNITWCQEAAQPLSLAPCPRGGQWGHARAGHQ